MATVIDRIEKLEKDHIECSATMGARMGQAEERDGVIFESLNDLSGKINSLPWKIFGIVGSTVTVLLGLAYFVFGNAMDGIQERYETFTAKIIELEIRNMNNEIDRLKKPAKTTANPRKNPHKNTL